MPYQYVREPLTAEGSDRLSNACETPTERLVVRTLLDTGLRVSEFSVLTAKDIPWQRRRTIGGEVHPTASHSLFSRCLSSPCNRNR